MLYPVSDGGYGRVEFPFEDMKALLHFTLKSKCVVCQCVLRPFNGHDQQCIHTFKNVKHSVCRFNIED